MNDDLGKQKTDLNTCLIRETEKKLKECNSLENVHWNRVKRRLSLLHEKLL